MAYAHNKSKLDFLYKSLTEMVTILLDSIKEAKQVWEDYIIRHLFYIDNGAAGGLDLEMMMSMKKQLTEAMTEGSFMLAKWK